MLIVLSGHLRVSGVTTWAVRTVKLLRARGERAGLLVHAHGGEEVPGFLEPYVVGCARSGPPMDARCGQLGGLIPEYLAALDRVRPSDGRPAVIAPSVPGDCYGVVAAIAQAQAEDLRVVGWVHADNGYDVRVALHYGPMVHVFVPVSDELVRLTRDAMPGRAGDIERIPHVIPSPGSAPARPSLSGRAVRLVYTGRVADEQKRVRALVSLTEQLAADGIAFELRIVGDGPEWAELETAYAAHDRVLMRGAVPPESVATDLAWADAWVLPSRYEGQSVAMLEAMSYGCVPIVTRGVSGMAGVVTHGETGLIADAGPDTCDAETGSALAHAVETLVRDGVGEMPERATAHVRSHHSEPVVAPRLEALLERVREAEPRRWPTDRPVAFSGGGPGPSGSTPSDAHRRMSSALAEVAGQRVALYGAGQHSIDLAGVLARADAEIVGFLDDNAKPGDRLWGWPVVHPRAAHTLGAEAVIISSWIHEEALHVKCGVLESQGMHVRRLYSEQAETASV